MLELSYKPRQSYKCLHFLGSLYLTTLIIYILLIQKIIHLPIVGDITASILVPGFFFVLGDIIAEVYGYKAYRKTILSTFILLGIFSLTMQIIANISSPTFFIGWASIQDPNGYQFIFGKIFHNFLSLAIAFLVATNINGFLISKWKILLRGRYFWLRSIASSGIGAFIFSSIGTFMVGFAALFHHQGGFVLKIIAVSFLIKIVTLIILAYPATIICIILKKVEGVDVYDYGVNYNPFKKENG